MTLTTGHLLHNRYRIARLLGQGGMGAVYRAWDLHLNVPVALKEMIPQPGIDAHTLNQLRSQFHQEAAVLSTLSHPNLVRVTDLFEESGNAYLVMSFVEGENLDSLIARQGALPEGQVLSWAGQLLDALAYCHSQGVIHRDIKPQNIIIRPNGQAVLVDFGLVKLWNPDDPRTRTVIRTMGTPAYSPPEQYMAASHTDPRSDLYSLGATLYHALTGQLPPTATMRASNPHALLHPCVISPSISPHVATAVLRALELRKESRFSSAAEMAQALTSPQGGYWPAGTAAPAGAVQAASAPAIAYQPPQLTLGGGHLPAWAKILGGMALLLLALGMVGAIAAGLFAMERNLPGPSDLSPTYTLPLPSPPTSTPTSPPLPPSPTTVPHRPPTSTPRPTTAPTSTPRPTTAPTSTRRPTLPPPTPTRVSQGGSLSLREYCQHLGYSDATLISRDVYGWRCRDRSGGLHGIDLYGACRWQYGGGRPEFTDYSNPNSWRCVP